MKEITKTAQKKAAMSEEVQEKIKKYVRFSKPNTSEEVTTEVGEKVSGRPTFKQSVLQLPSGKFGIVGTIPIELSDKVFNTREEAEQAVLNEN